MKVSKDEYEAWLQQPITVAILHELAEESEEVFEAKSSLDPLTMNQETFYAQSLSMSVHAQTIGELGERLLSGYYNEEEEDE